MSIATAPARPAAPTRASSFTWYVAVLLAAGLVVGAGLMHGLLSNRWGVPLDVRKLGKSLREVPLEIGPWVSAGDTELPANTVTLLECEGYIFRNYRHTGTGEVVAVAVLFGPKGPIAVHTPEVCYRSQDVVQTQDRSSQPNDFDGFENTLWHLDFETKSLDKAELNVCYGWSDGGPWYAAKYPRFWQTDYLYKIQLSSQSSRAGQDSTTDFLRQFLPELRKRMLTSGS